jgi:hypothetical protein
VAGERLDAIIGVAIAACAEQVGCRMTWSDAGPRVQVAGQPGLAAVLKEHATYRRRGAAA